jgi:hydrogenase maturation factor
MATPGLVVRVHGKNKDEIDVQFKDKTVTARNLIKDIKVGEYVILNDDLVIQRLSEKQAEKMM